MKILHALVGYYAVATLPFHPFAFASPLASIYYDSDGYVNLNTLQNHIDGALMKQVLGSIEETCQIVTAQNNSDSALVNHVPGDILEARQDIPAGDVLPAIAIITAILASVALSIVWIAYDNPVRGNNVELRTLIKSLLSETCGIYSKFYQH